MKSLPALEAGGSSRCQLVGVGTKQEPMKMALHKNARSSRNNPVIQEQNKTADLVVEPAPLAFGKSNFSKNAQSK
jgi:hypothetical protein